MNIRIIPRLDIKGPNLVKGIHFEGLRVLGKPEAFARHYYEHGADELIYQDVVASLYGRNSLLDIVERTSKEIFIPLCVGGGLRNLDDIRNVLRSGADKVAINTAAIDRPDLISEAARAFGSSTIVVSIEAMRQADGKYEAFADFGRQSTGVDAIEWASRAVELGAGELLITAIDREGTGKGYDLDLTRKIAESVLVPVIALGGAGSNEHVFKVVDQGQADAVSMASILHYGVIKDTEFRADDYSAEGNTEFLRAGKNVKSRKNICEASIADIKQYLIDNSVACRPVVQN